MKIFKFRKLVSLTMATTMFLAVAISSFATSINQSQNEQIKDKTQALSQQSIEQQNQMFFDDVKKIEPFVVRKTDGTLMIKGKPNVSKETLNGFKKNINETNKLIKAGVLETDSNLRIYSNEKYILKGNLRTKKTDYLNYDFNKNEKQKSLNVQNGPSAITIRDNYTPREGFYFYWWGMRLSMGAQATSRVIDVVNNGGNALAVIATLQGLGIITAGSGALTGLVAGTLKLGAGAINMINNWGGKRGVYIDTCPWRGVALPVTIWYRQYIV